MFFKPYYQESFSQASYLLGGADGTAVVIDPGGKVGAYLADASAAGLTITHVIGTHPHAKLLAGCRALAHRTGAEIWLGDGTNVPFPHHAARDGDTLGLGSVRLHVLSTPGSTLQSLTIVADLHQIPTLAFTGDTLLIGDVGRSKGADRTGDTADTMARTLFRSLRDKILTLPDDVAILPARGAETQGGKALFEAQTSTLARQLTENAALWLVGIGDEDGFVRLVTAKKPALPRDFADVDRAGGTTPPATVAGFAGVPPLSPDALRSLLDTGEAVVLDTRSSDAFGWAHVPGAVHIALDGAFAQAVAAVLPPDTPLVVITEPGQEAEGIARLAGTGCAPIAGWLDGGMETWEASGGPTVSLRQITPRGLHRLLRRAPETLVVDVQRQTGASRGRLAGALPIPLAEFAHRLPDLPRDVPLVLICDTGDCSSTAASLLMRAGRGSQLQGHVFGGWAAWELSEWPSLAPW